MAFCIIMGTNEFSSQLQGYENITAQCRNCGNWSARCITRWPWFTICWIPVLPLSTHKYKEVHCSICRFSQDLKDRPDVQSQMQGGGGGGMMPPQQHQQQQGPPQGWGGQQQGYGGPPGQKPQYA